MKRSNTQKLKDALEERPNPVFKTDFLTGLEKQRLPDSLMITIILFRQNLARTAHFSRHTFYFWQKLTRARLTHIHHSASAA